MGLQSRDPQTRPCGEGVNTRHREIQDVLVDFRKSIVYFDKKKILSGGAAGAFLPYTASQCTVRDVL